MDSDTIPQNPKPAVPGKIEPDVHDAVDMIKTYAPAVALGVVVALVVTITIVFYRNKEQSARERASELFLTAQSSAEFQDVFDRYPKSPVAPMALLAAAAQWYRDEVYDVSERLYRQFIEQYPDHVMRPAAQIGLAYCYEARGDIREALELFQAWSRADDHMSPVALLGEARMLGAMGDADAAFAIYNEILDDEEHAWRTQARTEKLYLEKRIRTAAAAQ